MKTYEVRFNYTGQSLYLVTAKNEAQAKEQGQARYFAGEDGDMPGWERADVECEDVSAEVLAHAADNNNQ